MKKLGKNAVVMHPLPRVDEVSGRGGGRTAEHPLLLFCQAAARVNSVQLGMHTSGAVT
jgi:hypothetical protein